MKIKSVKAIEILDSRGNPTVKCSVFLENGQYGQASVPSGASTGKYEALELRDHDETRFNGKGVLKAVENVNTTINQSLSGLDVEKQETIDKTLIKIDGTVNKSKLGANAILSVSMAAARAAATVTGLPLYEYLAQFNPRFDGTYRLPLPQFNVLNGGLHASWATDIQEYMIFPVGLPHFSDLLRMGVEIYQNLKKVLQENNYSTNVGDEGGFAPQVSSNEEPFRLLTRAVESAGYKLSSQVVFGIDAAASEFFTDGKYNLKKEGKIFDRDQLNQFYQSLKSKYPIFSFEDIFDQDDWQAFTDFTKKTDVQVVGDDLYVTNPSRLDRGIKEKTTNAVLVKLNQIGTVSETIKTINLAREHNFAVIVSHRSGETEDPFIADLAVGMGVSQIKSGAPARGERVAKYNRLLEIEQQLQDKASLSALPFKAF